MSKWTLIMGIDIFTTERIVMNQPALTSLPNTLLYPIVLITFPKTQTHH